MLAITLGEGHEGKAAMNKTPVRKRRRAVDKDGEASGNGKVPGGKPQTMSVTGPDGKAHYYLRVDDDDLMLLRTYEDAKENYPGFFEHIGMDPDVSYGGFRDHYDKGSVADIDRVAMDLFTYPPGWAHIMTTIEIKEERALLGAYLQ